MLAFVWCHPFMYIVCVSVIFCGMLITQCVDRNRSHCQLLLASAAIKFDSRCLSRSFVILFIPLVRSVLMPAWERCSRKPCCTALHPTPLRRMGIGMLLVALSFVIASGVSKQVELAGDGHVSVAWIVPQYAVLSFGEIFTSTTGML